MPNICSKSQYAKNQVDGAEEPTINNFFEFDSRQFWKCYLKCRLWH